MKIFSHPISLFLLVALLLTHNFNLHAFGGSNANQEEEEPQKGSHGGRLLIDEDFVLELAIFETGVPPEYRVWITDKQGLVDAAEVALKITLTRLGGIQDRIKFAVQGDFLRGDTVIYEPHSFVVTVKAEYQGQSHHWQYDSFEGRTTIEPAVAKALAIETTIAGPQVLKETISVYGKLVTHPESIRHMAARFEGTIKSVEVSLGQKVKKGDPLFTIESNESLKPYTVVAPIDGIVQQRNANSGEQTNGRTLLSLINNEVLISELSVFPRDRDRVSVGDIVWLTVKGRDERVSATIIQLDNIIQANQSIITRAQLNNEQGDLKPGAFIQGEIEVAEHQVPLAVKRSGLQAFRDFTVVFAKVDNQYEVRMLDLGRVAGEWVEVIGGLSPGTEYVSENSYIIKADIEKSGASHDH